MASVSLEGVVKQFGSTPVVRNVSLSVADGEVLALLGPSGSGKTTMLRLMAGFESPDAGRILLADRDVTGHRAVERRCGMVFQHYALFPHLTVGENVAYGLADREWSSAQRTTRVAESLALVDLAGYERRAVTALSGGQQQRVALARALAPEPAVLLLDEPLSNLDPTLRERTRRELRDLVRRIGITTVLVTHEQEEAFDLADRVALLLGGTLAQVGPPEELYRRPATAGVATFIGRTTEVPFTLAQGDGDRCIVRALGIELEAQRGGGSRAEDLQTLLLRPEALRPDADGPIEGVVRHRRFLGAHDLLTVQVGEVSVEVLSTLASVRGGEVIRLTPTGTGAHLFGSPA